MDFTLAHDFGLNLFDVVEGFVHDGRSRSPIGLERNDRPRRRSRGVLVGAHDVEECTSNGRLVSGELESPSPAVGPVDTDNDPELIWAVCAGVAARESGHNVQ